MYGLGSDDAAAASVEPALVAHKVVHYRKDRNSQWLNATIIERSAA